MLNPIKYLATAKETLQYPEYKEPNWIKGNVYEAKDAGHTIYLSSETGPFAFDRRESWKEEMSVCFDFTIIIE